MAYNLRYIKGFKCLYLIESLAKSVLFFGLYIGTSSKKLCQCS